MVTSLHQPFHSGKNDQEPQNNIKTGAFLIIVVPSFSLSNKGKADADDNDDDDDDDGDDVNDDDDDDDDSSQTIERK